MKKPAPKSDMLKKLHIPKSILEDVSAWSSDAYTTSDAASGITNEKLTEMIMRLALSGNTGTYPQVATHPGQAIDGKELPFINVKALLILAELRTELIIEKKKIEKAKEDTSMKATWKKLKERLTGRDEGLNVAIKKVDEAIKQLEAYIKTL